MSRFNVVLRVTMLTLALILAASAGKLDAQVTEWTRQFGGEGHNTYDYATAVDVDGNIYIAGYVSGVLPDQGSQGSSDAFLRKYDVDGNEVWTCQFGSDSYDRASGIAIGRTGVYVTGTTQGTLPGQVKVGEYGDAFVRKYDFNGNEIWTSQFGTDYYTEARGISICDDQGNDRVYVTGSAYTSTGGYDAFVSKHDLTGNVVWLHQFELHPSATHSYGISACPGGVFIAGETYYNADGFRDMFLRKYDTNGICKWTKFYAGIGNDGGYAISADPTGVYVVGYTERILGEKWDAHIQKYDIGDGHMHWMYFVGGPPVGGRSRTYGYGVTSRIVNNTWDGAYVCGWTSGITGQTGPGGYDAFVAEFSGMGSLLWVDQFGTSSTDYGYGISMDSDANHRDLYIAGVTYGTFPGQTRLGSGGDAYVTKYDAITQLEVWTCQFSSSSANDYVGYPGQNKGQAIDSDGNVWVTGSTSGTLPGQTKSGLSEYYYDAFVRGYDAGGSEIWTRQFGTSSSDYGLGVWAAADGIYVCGSTRGDLVTTPTTPGYWDAFVRKYDLDGNEIWTSQFGGGSGSYTYAYAVYADDSGVYLVGYTSGALVSGQPNLGLSDGFVRKYTHSGVEDWTIQFGSSDYDYAYGIAGDETGIYVCGYSFNPETPAYEAFVIKYDLDGTQLWSDEFGAGYQNDCYSSPAVDPTGVYVTGSTTGSFPGCSNPSGLWEVYVRKYDTDGNENWTTQFGTPEYDHSYGIAAEPTGVYVTGQTYGTLPGQTSAGATDAFVWKGDANGNEVWTYQFGTGGNDAGVGISVATSGTYANAIYVGGNTSSTFSGQMGCGGNDAFVMNIREDPEDMLAALVEFVVSLNLHHGIENSLDAKLDAAHKALSDLKEKNDIAAVNSLGAFKNEVLAQRGVHIPEDAADKLIKSAQAILDLLEHGGGGVQSVSVRSPETSKVVLHQNHPNPFRDATTIRLSLPETSHAKLTVHDVAGRTVATLVDEELGAGTHTVNWSTGQPSGVYFARIQAGTSSEMMRMVLLK